MTEFVGEWVSNLPPQALYIVPVLAFLESCLFVGLFVSGVFLLSAVSLIYAGGDTGLFSLIALSFLAPCSVTISATLPGPSPLPRSGRKDGSDRVSCSAKVPIAEFAAC